MFAFRVRPKEIQGEKFALLANRQNSFVHSGGVDSVQPGPVHWTAVSVRVYKNESGAPKSDISRNASASASQ